MSRPARNLLATAALVLGVHGALAQTIGDYSRAQRALLESAMSQAAAHAAGAVASAPPPSPAAAASSPMPGGLPMLRSPLPAPGPVVQVTGVFAGGDTSLAEIVVNATAYLLGAGQGVPGTTWRVETVAVDRVVLSRHAGTPTADADGVRKVFDLPALR